MVKTFSLDEDDEMLNDSDLDIMRNEAPELVPIDGEDPEDVCNECVDGSDEDGFENLCAGRGCRQSCCTAALRSGCARRAHGGKVAGQGQLMNRLN